VAPRTDTDSIEAIEAGEFPTEGQISAEQLASLMAYPVTLPHKKYN